LAAKKREKEEAELAAASAVILGENQMEIKIIKSNTLKDVKFDQIKVNLGTAEEYCFKAEDLLNNKFLSTTLFITSAETTLALKMTQLN